MVLTLSGLQVLGVRYAGSRFVGDQQRALNAYLKEDVYKQAQVPFAYVEPRMPETMQSDDQVIRYGVLGSAIAEAVAPARRAGKAILLVGGNCHCATGVLGGLQDAHGPAARIGLVWFDAHGDFNTPNTTLSGSLGGMPVAVCAGLALPEWRERSHVVAPLPTNRIVMTDLRNLDLPEEQLLRATDVVVAAPAPGFPGQDLGQAVSELADRVDMIYLHIDADILDARFVPHHRTKEPDGPDMAQVLAAIGTVMATNKVVALAIVSVYFGGESRVDVASGVEMVRGSLALWRQHSDWKSA